jgi:3-oxoacid CoA-transferase subunit B
VTDLGLFEIREGAFHLLEVAPGVSVDEVRAKTAGKLVVERRSEGNGVVKKGY